MILIQLKTNDWSMFMISNKTSIGNCFYYTKINHKFHLVSHRFKSINYEFNTKFIGKSFSAHINNFICLSKGAANRQQIEFKFNTKVFVINIFGYQENWKHDF